MDFTPAAYKELLERLRSSGYHFFRFDQYYQNRDEIDLLERVVLLRHDIDRSPSQAIRLAQIEANLGIHGSYYFRMKPWVFKPVILKTITELGHEIGYHYECLADARGDLPKARDLMNRNLARFSKVTRVKTAAMHSRPLSKWDSRLIFDHYDMREFGLAGEAYRSVDHNRYIYIADSGRNWNSSRTVVWDKVEGISLPLIKGGTFGLADYLKQNGHKVQLLVHPNRWRGNPVQWTLQLASDLAINTAKKIILAVRPPAKKGTS